MKALSLIALFFAVFLVFLGATSKGPAGAVLGNAIIAGGVIIAAIVAAVWIVMLIKEKREK